MIKKILKVLAVLTLLLVVVISVSFFSSKKSAMQRLSDQASIIQTVAGPVEYRLIQMPGGDEHPVILYIPPAAYDSVPLYSENYHVLIPSRPGYGGTPLSSGVSPLAQARTYAALLEALNIDSVIVMTVSAGGASALSFAEHYPQLTRAMVAIAPVSQAFEGEQLPGFLQSDFNFWAVINVVEWLGDETIAKLVFSSNANSRLVLGRPELMAQVKAVPWAMWPVSARLAGIENDKITFSELQLHPEEIEAPVLLIHGTADDRVPFSHSEQLMEKLYEVEFFPITGADHMLILSHAELVKRRVGNFLRAKVGER